MNCSKCKAKTKVLDKRDRANYTWRRLKCLKCNHKFSTNETLAKPKARRSLEAYKPIVPYEA